MTLTVAALQLASRLGDVGANLDHLEEAVNALPADTALAVAPELFNTGYDLELLATSEAQTLAEPADGPTVARIGEIARRAELALAAGFLEGDNGRLYDSVVVAGAGADPVVYRKTHLYPPEAAVFAAGDDLVIADARHARVGLMICFEHAFPEIATTLALDGADILAIPSAVPAGYEHVLGLRTRARAQDNQVFAVGCNAPEPFCGRSLIVDPRGEVLAEAGTREEVLIAALDLAVAAAERNREPSLRLRRPDLYR